MEEVQKKQAISLSEVKEILGKVDPEEMDQIQRWTYDYVSKFVALDPKDAKEMKSREIYGDSALKYGVNYEKDTVLMSNNSDWRDSSQKHL